MIETIAILLGFDQVESADIPPVYDLLPEQYFDRPKLTMAVQLDHSREQEQQRRTRTPSRVAPDVQNVLTPLTAKQIHVT